MRYRRLGSSGLLVSEIGLGTATFGELADVDEVDAIVGTAIDAGTNLVDTGNIYAQGRSEEMLGRVLGSRRDRVVLCTKVGYRVGDLPSQHMTVGAASDAGAADPNGMGLSRKHITSAVEDSLRRLNVDYIDLYQVHRWDDGTPIEETLSALDDLVRSGKVRYIGCSKFASWQLVRSLWLSDVAGLERFVAMQLPYNLLKADESADEFAAMSEFGVGSMVFQPLAGGMLTGRYEEGVTPAADSRFGVRAGYMDQYWNRKAFHVVDELRTLSEQFGLTPAHLSLGWLLAQPKVNVVLVGADRASEFTENLGAVERPLTGDELEALDKVLAWQPDAEA